MPSLDPHINLKDIQYGSPVLMIIDSTALNSTKYATYIYL